jgi:uncharacterized membrane protein
MKGSRGLRSAMRMPAAAGRWAWGTFGRPQAPDRRQRACTCRPHQDRSVQASPAPTVKRHDCTAPAARRGSARGRTAGSPWARWVGALLTTLATSTGAQADLRFCNRTSYVLDLALGLEDKGGVATRGWFRVVPGQCRLVLQGTLEAEQIYVHARALELYGSPPVPQTGHAELCVADGNFVIAGARSCSTRKAQRPVAFTAVKPIETDQGLTATLSEEAEYSDDQARLAGIQRLLSLCGYDVNPIDGIPGKKTDTAITQFLQDHQLANEAAIAPSFFDGLAEAATKTQSAFGWCNDTAYTVMASLGVESNAAIVTRGWYRIEPGRCLKPPISGQPRRLYSYAEAVDKDGQTVKRGDQWLAWGGTTILCTRPDRFEISDHMDCGAKGLDMLGFALIDPGSGSSTLRLREP